MSNNPSITSKLYTSPVGLEYFGTHQMPLIDSSDSTNVLTSSKSGPSPVKLTGIILMPKVSHSLKCLSYPGTGHSTETRSLLFQGPDPLP